MSPNSLQRLYDDFAAQVRQKEAPREEIGWIRPSGRLSPPERVKIYQRAFQLRMEEALEEDFPRVRHAIGDVEFSRQVARYVSAYPSRSWTLSDLGAGFEAFLRERDESLADLAAREWAGVHCLQAVEIDPARIQAELAQAGLGTRLRLSASARLLRLSRGEVWMVYRGPDFELREESLAELPASLLGLLKEREGRTVEELATWAEGKVDPDTFQAWFARWMGLGWFELVNGKRKGEV